MSKPVLLPTPLPSAEEIPEGFKVVTFDCLVVPHPTIIGAYTPMSVLVPDNPEFQESIAAIGEQARRSGENFAEAMKRDRPDR